SGGAAERPRDPGVGPAERGGPLSRMEAAGRELLSLIESTLEVGKLEAGRADVRLEEVPLPAFWAEVRRGCAGLPRRPEIALEWSDAPAIALKTDPRKLTIVVRNLVGNALKFTERGSVRVDVGLAGDALVLPVAGTG